VKRDLGLFSPIGFHPYGGAVFEERSPQGLGAFHNFLHHYRFLERKNYEEDDICLHLFAVTFGPEMIEQFMKAQAFL
jgi:hypothetical protein